MKLTISWKIECARRPLHAGNLGLGRAPARVELCLLCRLGRRRRLACAGRRLGGPQIRDLLVDVGKLEAQIGEDPRAVVAEEEKRDAEDRQRIVDRIDPRPEFRRLPPAAAA